MDTLTEAEILALQEALDDEYRAWATYDQVISDFGEVRPFTRIREAEARHIEALRTLFIRYALAVPENTWPGRVDRYPNVRVACEAGVSAEIANGAMYKRLCAVTRRNDVLAVLRRLQQASQQRHLPAFQRCTQGTARGGGRHPARRRHRGRNR